MSRVTPVGRRALSCELRARGPMSASGTMPASGSMSATAAAVTMTTASMTPASMAISVVSSASAAVFAMFTVLTMVLTVGAPAAAPVAHKREGEGRGHQGEAARRTGGCSTTDHDERPIATVRRSLSRSLSAELQRRRSAAAVPTCGVFLAGISRLGVNYVPGVALRVLLDSHVDKSPDRTSIKPVMLRDRSRRPSGPRTKDGI